MVDSIKQVTHRGGGASRTISTQSHSATSPSPLYRRASSSAEDEANALAYQRKNYKIYMLDLPGCKILGCKMFSNIMQGIYSGGGGSSGSKNDLGAFPLSPPRRDPVAVTLYHTACSSLDMARRIAGW